MTCFQLFYTVIVDIIRLHADTSVNIFISFIPTKWEPDIINWHQFYPFNPYPAETETLGFHLDIPKNDNG